MFSPTVSEILPFEATLVLWAKWLNKCNSKIWKTAVLD